MPAPSQKFEIKRLNPTPLTAEDTNDFLPKHGFHYKRRHGKLVGKRELSLKLFSSRIRCVWEPNARPHRFFETRLYPARGAGCRRPREGLRSRREPLAHTISESVHFFAGLDKPVEPTPKPLMSRRKAIMFEKEFARLNSIDPDVFN